MIAKVLSRGSGVVSMADDSHEGSLHLARYLLIKEMPRFFDCAM